VSYELYFLVIYFGKSPDLAKWPICILPKQQNGKGINVELDVERSDYFDLISSHKRREPNVFDDNLNSPRLPSKYRYHPLIHTRVEFILAQNMAGDYQGMKSALKYDFQIPTKRIGKSTHLRWHFYCFSKVR